MMIKLSTVYSLIQSGAFQALDNAQLTAKEKWNAMKFVSQVEKEYEAIEKLRVELVKKYGKPGEGDRYTLRDETKETFTRELTAVLNEEVEVHAVTLPLSSVSTLTLSQLKALEDFIDEEA